MVDGKRAMRTTEGYKPSTCSTAASTMIFSIR
jgi:hypothetical protein